MQISLWQQFSSNNSTSYTVVGVFDSAESVQRASRTLSLIGQQIKDWYEKHPQAFDQWDEGWPYPPSTVEQQIGQEYGFDWKEGADWPFNNVEIRILNNLLFVETKIPRPDLGPTALNLLILKLGGSFFVEGSQYGETIGRLRIEITCTAPDSEVAAAIVKRESWPEFCTVTEDNLQLTILIVDTYEYGGFPQILFDLQAQGCTDIQVEFDQIELGEL
jgi:hypothetical protein